MAIKKYTNGSWVPASYRKYGTETDAITTLPATIIGDGTPISSYTIKGNMEQSGTPTPSSPIYPSECGERTENLLDLSLNNWEQGIINAGGGRSNTDYAIRTIGKIKVEPNTTYTLKNWDTSKFHIAYHQWESDEAYVSDSGWQLRSTIVFTTSPKTTLIEFTVRSAKFSFIHPSDIADSSAFSFVLGDVPPDHYIPYGYKLPLTLGSTTTDIYLGEVQSTRRIKKLVLTGEEDWQKSSGGCNAFYFYMNAHHMYPYHKKENSALICNIATYTTITYNYTKYPWYCVSDNTFGISTDSTVVGGTTVNEFKSWLAAQYAAGTPVTIWYVLAEPTSGIVNEPLRKIGDYVDSVSGTNLATSGTGQTFDINTTLKPSEVDMTYHGWHEHADTKFTT